MIAFGVDLMTITFREDQEDLERLKFLEKRLRIKTKTGIIREALRIAYNVLK